MNIFEYNDKEYDKKLEEIFSNIDKEQLKKDLISCGLEINMEVKKLDLKLEKGHAVFLILME